MSAAEFLKPLYDYVEFEFRIRIENTMPTRIPISARTRNDTS